MKKIIIVLVLISVLLPLGVTLAQETSADGSVILENPIKTQLKDLEGEEFINTLIGLVIRFVLGVIGAVALFMFVYGGFLMLTSGGIEDRINKGKEIIKWAVVGVIVTMGSYAIVSFILEALT